MSSGSPSIGDAREQAATFVARSHKTLPSLQVQSVPGDAFADVFRLIANASPAPNRTSSRDSQLRADAGNTKDDARQSPEKTSSSASKDARDSRTSIKDRPQEEPLVDLTLMVPEGETPFAETEGVANPRTGEDENHPQNGLLSGAEIVAASQHQTIVAAGSPEEPPLTSESASEGVPVVGGQTGAATSSDETGTAKPEAIEIPPTLTSEASQQTPLKEGVPVDGELISKQNTSGSATGDFSEEPVLPKPPSETSIAEPSERVERSTDGLEDEMIEETGKPLFAGREDDRASSRRRHGHEPRISPTAPDANPGALDSSSAEMRGMQAEIVSPEPAFDATASDRAVRDLSQTVDALQTNANSASPPAVSAAAASGSAMAEAVSSKASAKPTPQVGVGAAPAETTEKTQRPAAKGASGPGVADRIRLVQRVANAFQRLGVDGGQVRIRLHPTELGSVRLDLQIQGKRLNARVTAETEAARGVLREHLPELRQRLVEQGIQIERMDVELETETRDNRHAPDQEASAGRFGQPQRRGNRGESLRSEREQSDASTSAGASGQPVERSVADAASRPGVDLVF